MSAEWPLLKAGNQGAPVKALQRLLVHGVDGIVGPHTWHGLLVANSAS